MKKENEREESKIKEIQGYFKEKKNRGQIIAIAASFSAEEFAPFPQIMAVIHDFHNFERFIRT